MITKRREYGRFDGETPIYCGMCGYDGADGWLVDEHGISCSVCLALAIAINNRRPEGVTPEAAALIDKLLRDWPKIRPKE